MNYPILLIAEKLQVENISKEQSFQEQFEGLANYLDHLVATDFNRLISILYRIDVSEDKARKALADEAGKISPGHTLARLLIERESEKIKFREQYRSKKSEE
ncbi:hypothetical protein [Sphingobacterium daejeonense]|jgi:hypothetical protein|uniref:hypothetical protein n=1 Tax=Sphingobacterium daejeonense TaxID=371142 RepID=UPI0010C448A5|nr:hypothetical protein [Sphingobacterium daejeonense]VTQ06515.1 Uncharacterised protein [Sphingobacterium daejeonense]